MPKSSVTWAKSLYCCPDWSRCSAGAIQIGPSTLAILVAIENTTLTYKEHNLTNDMTSVQRLLYGYKTVSRITQTMEIRMMSCWI